MPAAKPTPELELRRVRFGHFVERTVAAAKGRGMTTADMEKATGLGNSTWYGWIKGEWARDPVPDKVHAFCNGLGASIEEAYRMLGWNIAQLGQRASAEPLAEDADVRALMRKLTDPKTPAATKLLIRRTIRALVGENTEP